MSVNYTLPIEMTYFDATALNLANYQPINAWMLDAACSIIRVVNTSDAAIWISLDGVTDHDYIRPGGDIILNLQLNSHRENRVAQMKNRSIVYVRGTPPKFGGWIYLMGYYNPTS